MVPPSPMFKLSMNHDRDKIQWELIKSSVP